MCKIMCDYSTNYKKESREILAMQKERSSQFFATGEEFFEWLKDNLTAGGEWSQYEVPWSLSSIQMISPTGLLLLHVLDPDMIIEPETGRDFGKFLYWGNLDDKQGYLDIRQIKNIELGAPRDFKFEYHGITVKMNSSIAKRA